MKRKAPEETQRAFHPWAPVPMGSIGGEWDARVPLPRDVAADRRAAAEQTKREQAMRKRQLAEIDPEKLVIRRAWSMWANGTAVLAAMALVSTGPLATMQLPLCAAVIVAVPITIWRLRNRTVFHRGAGLAIVSLLVAVLIIADVVSQRMGYDWRALLGNS